jgi:hypothetical protein
VIGTGGHDACRIDCGQSTHQAHAQADSMAALSLQSENYVEGPRGRPPKLRILAAIRLRFFNARRGRHQLADPI